MNKYIVIPFLILIYSMDTFAYSFVGEGKSDPTFDKDLDWLLNIGLEIKIEDLSFEPDSDYREVFFKITESEGVRNASSINLVILKGEEVLAIIKEFDLSSARSFSVSVSKDTLMSNSHKN